MNINAYFSLIVKINKYTKKFMQIGQAIPEFWENLQAYIQRSYFIVKIIFCAKNVANCKNYYIAKNCSCKFAIIK